MQDFERTGRNRDSTLGGHTHSSVHIRTKGEGAATPKKTEPDTPAGVGAYPAEAGCGCGSPKGQGHGQKKFWEVLLGMTLPESTISLTKEPVASSAGSPQAKQPIGRELSRTHQQTSGLKFY